MKPRPILLLCALLLPGTIQALETTVLRMMGDEAKPSYASEILKRSLEADGHTVKMIYLGTNLPTTRLEYLIESGEASCAILGETRERNAKFSPIPIGMTDGLMGKRILFIPKGSQHEYDNVKTLADLRALGKTAGMGSAWPDIGIWERNGLPFLPQAGDWKVLYRMVESRVRKVDYLPRGAVEILNERLEHRYLDVEQNLLLVYDKDSIVYVSPKEPALKIKLERALAKARDSGLIRKTVAEFYSAVFDPPLDINRRRVIRLTLP